MVLEPIYRVQLLIEQQLLSFRFFFSAYAAINIVTEINSNALESCESVGLVFQIKLGGSKKAWHLLELDNLLLDCSTSNLINIDHKLLVFIKV